MSDFHAAWVAQTSNGILICKHPSHDMGISYDCYGIEDAISANMDAGWVKPGQYVIFNVWPDVPHSVTSVRITPEPILGEVYQLRGMHTRDTGGTTSLDLGVWMPGEGRKSIRATMQQALARCVDPRDVFSKTPTIYTKCPNPAHGLSEDRRMKAAAARNENTYRQVCLFNMILEKMCTECLAGVQAAANSNFGIPEDVDA